MARSIPVKIFPYWYYLDPQQRNFVIRPKPKVKQKLIGTLHLKRKKYEP